MVLTVLEARIAPERANDLEAAFKGAGKLPPGLIRSHLLRDGKDPHVWRIQTLWESREAIAAMRASGETPAGILMFRSAGAEPTLSVFEVVATLD